MDFRILGPLEVIEDGQALPLGAAKQQVVLAVLLLHPNEVVSVSRLVDELWGVSPPVTAAKVVQGYVSGLRKMLGPQTIITRSGAIWLESSPIAWTPPVSKALPVRDGLSVDAQSPSQEQSRSCSVKRSCLRSLAQQPLLFRG
jgi:hypothetical protein